MCVFYTFQGSKSLCIHDDCRFTGRRRIAIIQRWGSVQLSPRVWVQIILDILAHGCLPHQHMHARVASKLDTVRCTKTCQMNRTKISLSVPGFVRRRVQHLCGTMLVFLCEFPTKFLVQWTWFNVWNKDCSDIKACNRGIEDDKPRASNVYPVTLSCEVIRYLRVE